MAEDDLAWETLLLARKRTQVSLVDLIAAIHDARLAVGQRVGTIGFHGLVLRMTDADVLPPSRPRGKAPDGFATAGMTSAARFGRSVGLRDEGSFLALVDAGHVPAVLMANPATGHPQQYLRPEDVAAFHRRFVTLTTLSAETGLNRNTLRGQLAAGGVARFAADGQSFGPVYLREEVVTTLCQTPAADRRVADRKMLLDAD